MLAAVAAYKQLGEVERGFRSLKDVIALRPIWHHRPSRVKGHIFVAALALLLERLLEKRLKEAGVDSPCIDGGATAVKRGQVELFVIPAGSYVGKAPDIGARERPAR